MELFFDLDGTLTDPAVGITLSIQHALAALGRSAPPARELHRFIGPPLRSTFAELLATDDAELIDRAIGYYRERFSTIGIFENEVYPDVPAGLAALHEAGHRLCVVTSKPRIYAARIVDHFKMAGWFAAVHGSELSGANAEKVDLIRHVLEQEQVDRGRVWMIGDRAVDVLGGRANGVRTIAVRWGYGPEEELREACPDAIVASMAELRDVVGAP